MEAETVWLVIAGALFTCCLALLGLIFSRVSGDLASVAKELREVSQIVREHELRLGFLEGP